MAEPLSVSQLNDFVYNLLNSQPFLNNVMVVGEVSNYRKQQSKHMYFSLKDAQSVIRCVKFFDGQEIDLKEGMMAVVTGRVSLYKQGGQYQLYATSVRPYGLGDMYAALEQLKEKLAKEGLFAAELKRPIPPFPRRIGVVTSSTGAVVRDIMNVSLRRNPNADVLVYHAKVQGEGGADEIISGIEYLNGVESVDVIIIARGGGSLEDLWEFNNERLARAIRESMKPIVSAVGHETDFTIADFVSDLRAPTPSAAAEICVPIVADVIRGLEDAALRMNRCLISTHEGFKLELTIRERRLNADQIRRLMEQHQQRLDHQHERMRTLSATAVEERRGSLNTALNRLAALNPKGVLKRGYAIVRVGESVAERKKDLKPGQRVEIVLQDGGVQAQVLSEGERSRSSVRPKSNVSGEQISLF